MSIDLPHNRMYGYFEHSMDDKGRIIIPQRFREHLGEEFVLTMGPSRSVRAYPRPVWEQVEAAYASKSAHDEYDSTAQLLQRMIGSCDFVSLDAQNRVTIPRFLKDWAKLSEREQSAVLGTGSHIEFRRISALDELQESCTEEAISRANAIRVGDAFYDSAEPHAESAAGFSETAATSPATV